MSNCYIIRTSKLSDHFELKEKNRSCENEVADHGFDRMKKQRQSS